MKNEFDNSKVNDGRNRINLPRNVKNTGGGSKFGKGIIFILILLLLAIYGILVYRNGNENFEKITQAEWNEMLIENFGRGIDVTAPESIMTGEDIALCTISLVNEKRLLALTDNNEINEEELEKIADKYDIVSEQQLKKKFGREDAENALAAFLDFYTSEETYLEYQEYEYKSDVIDSSKWEIAEESGVLLHSQVKCESKPEVGKIILVDDPTTGYARALRIINVEEIDSGYDVQFEEVTDPEEVFEKIYFSGYGHISEDSQIDTSANVDVGLYPSEISQTDTSNGLLFQPETVYAYEFSKNYAMDIKFIVDYKNEDGKQSINNEVTVDGESKYKNETEFGTENNYDNWSANGEITGSVELKDFTVLASATMFEGDNNSVEVILSTDVINDLEFKGKFEGKWELATIPITICGLKDPIFNKNIGSVTADIHFYLLVNADGEIVLTYTLTGAKVGASATLGEGFQLIKEKPVSEADIDGYVTITAGLSTEVDLQAQVLNFDPLEVANPSFTVGAYAHGEPLEQNEGFEEYPKCVDLKFAAPTLNFNASDNGDTLLAEIMGKLNVQTSYDIFTESNAIVQKEWHIEWDLEGDASKLDGGEEKCTHINKEELDDKIENEINKGELDDKIDNEINKKKEETEEKAKRTVTDAIQEWLDNWLNEACDEC